MAGKSSKTKSPLREGKKTRKEEIKMKAFAFREKFPDFDLLEDSIFG